MKAIALTGLKKSGKTTVGVDLVKELKSRGLAVAVAKSTRHHFDKTDTDTGKYREAGVPVIAMGSDESFVAWPRNRELVDLIPLVRADILIVEGGKELGFLPRVLFLNGQENLSEIPPDLRPELAVGVYGPEDQCGLPAVDSVSDLADLALEKGFVLAGLDCGGCGREDCAELAAAIAAGEASAADCVALGGSCEVEVNGRKIALNPFVEETFIGVIKGLLAPLKGCSSGAVRIELNIDRQ